MSVFTDITVWLQVVQLIFETSQQPRRFVPAPSLTPEVQGALGYRTLIQSRFWAGFPQVA